MIEIIRGVLFLLVILCVCMFVLLVVAYVQMALIWLMNELRAFWRYILPGHHRPDQGIR